MPADMPPRARECCCYADIFLLYARYGTTCRAPVCAACHAVRHVTRACFYTLMPDAADGYVTARRDDAATAIFDTA